MKDIPWRSCLVLLLSAGCGTEAGPSSSSPSGDSSDTEITELTGEVHLHQFPAGAHAWAAFLADPIPLSSVHGDQLVNIDEAPVRREGPCLLYLTPQCNPGCTETQQCLAENTCVSIMPVTYVDAGDVRVTGSLIYPLIRMWFISPDSTYDADPTPGPTLLYKGGEVLHVQGGQGHYALQGDIPAPLPVVVSAPDPAAPLHLPADRDLDVSWQPGGGQLILLRLLVSSSTGHTGYLRCLSPDSGSLVVPGDLLAQLPPPPRVIRFELERDEERFLPTRQSGVGILTHATFTAWRNANE